MSYSNDVKQGKLLYTFPKLSEENQHFILGVASGLRFFQEKHKELLDEKRLIHFKFREVMKE